MGNFKRAFCGAGIALAITALGCEKAPPGVGVASQAIMGCPDGGCPDGGVYGGEAGYPADGFVRYDFSSPPDGSRSSDLGATDGAPPDGKSLFDGFGLHPDLTIPAPPDLSAPADLTPLDLSGPPDLDCPHNQYNGTPCGSTCACASGNCWRGVCCDAPCTGACQSCGGPGAIGTCGTDTPGSAGSPSCAPFVCDGNSPSCPGWCQSDADCESGTWYDMVGQCEPVLAAGSVCTRGTQCLSGNCAQGVCCDALCTRACESCDVQGHVGSCVPVPQGAVGSPSCAPYVCSGVAVDCPASCQADGDCVQGDSCIGGVCGAPPQQGPDLAPPPVACPLYYKYCPNFGTCGNCCSPADCPNPPDACHPQGLATCDQGACSYNGLVCPAGQGCVAGACAAAPVSFQVTVTTPVIFTAGMDPVLLRDFDTVGLFQASLTNTSRGPVSVSVEEVGTLSVLSLTRDGAPVPPWSDSGLPGELPDFTASLALRTLQPGDVQAFSIHGLSFFGPDPYQPSRRFGPVTPATYEVTFQYQYRGRDPVNVPGIYHGVITAAPVSFRVQ